MTTRITASLLALLLLLGAGSALAAPSNQIAGLEATIHGGAQLELSSCLHPDASGGALFLAFIDNNSDAPAQRYTVTLHDDTGSLLADRSYTALQPGDSDVFALRLTAAQVQGLALSSSTRCDDGR